MNPSLFFTSFVIIFFLTRDNTLSRSVACANSQCMFVQTLKLELELRDERVSALTRQLDELSLAGQGDQELTQLRKSKHDLEAKVKDQVSVSIKI